MGKIKTIEVSIIYLRITSEDEWLDQWIKDYGDSVYQSPQYRLLREDAKPFIDWMVYRGIEPMPRVEIIRKLWEDIGENGQKQPIKIYKDMRINTGHKRAAVMAILKNKKIKAVKVPDNYKL